MTEQQYALNRSGPKRLKISYPLAMTKVMIQLDGVDVGKIEGRGALKAGRDFTLSDGSTLNVKLVSNQLSSQIQVLRDGKPLPGSATDPYRILADTAHAVFFIAIVNIAVGLGTEVFRIDFLNSLSSGWLSVGFGILFAALGFGIRSGSRVTLGVALALFGIDTVLLVQNVIAGNQTASVGGFVVRIFLFAVMIRGFGAITKINQAEAEGLDSKQQTDIWANLKKGLGVVAVVSVLLVVGLAATQIMLPTSVQSTKVLPTVASLPTPQITSTPLVLQITYPPHDYMTLSFERPKTALQRVNLPENLTTKPLIPGDLAWNKPTFAESFHEEAYPSLATSGGSGWHNTETSTWFLVDLQSPQMMHQLIVSHFVDSATNDWATSYYVVSNNLFDWQVVVRESDYIKTNMLFKSRILTLEKDVTARYIFVDILNWRGGIESFAVIPPGYDYTPETLPALEA